MNILTVGTFDLNTPGHIMLFEWCRKLAGRDGKVFVGLNKDEFITRYKGKPPILKFEEREVIVGAYRQVDYVIENIDDEDLRTTILAVKPNMLVVGSDWLKKDYFKQTQLSAEWLEEHRIALCFIPRYLDHSTTALKERIKE